jgi:hypothetical protein
MRLPTMTTRRLMTAVAVVAVALSVEGAVTVMAFLVLIRAVRRPQPVHLTTTILLTLLAGILLWANLRPTVWQEEFGGGIDAPTGLDPITKAMFWRGWPLSPCMICLIHGMRLHPSGIEGCVLVFDGVLFLVALFAAKAVCESCFRWLQHRKL